jgi:riboflavin synthase
MFTGLIQDVGSVARIEKSGENTRLVIRTKMDLKQVALGDSISVEGYCQTVVHISNDLFAVEVSPETLERTTAGSLRVGARVNLEPALRLSDRLGGHLVSGHIDGVGTIKGIDAGKKFHAIQIEAPESILRYCIEKGSVAVDGISLTINKVDSTSLTVGIIPHTADQTTLIAKSVGDRVNLECDLIGKYVERFLSASMGKTTENQGEKIDQGFLAKHGFLK